eukprot:2567616-Prymnesium_polylepis.1
MTNDREKDRYYRMVLRRFSDGRVLYVPRFIPSRWRWVPLFLEYKAKINLCIKSADAEKRATDYGIGKAPTVDRSAKAQYSMPLCQRIRTGHSNQHLRGHRAPPLKLSSTARDMHAMSDDASLISISSLHLGFWDI